jgi:hypothetical protein
MPMKLGEGISYHADGVRPAPQVRPSARVQAKRPVRRPVAVAPAGRGWPGRAFSGFGDDGFKVPYQAQISAVTKSFNGGGFTPADILPSLQAAVAMATENLNQAGYTNSADYVWGSQQLLSDARNDATRAQRMLTQMQAQAAKGDVNVYSNPSLTWAAVKDAVLGPVLWRSNWRATMEANDDATRSLVGIVAEAIRDVPSTILHTAANVVEGAADYARDQLKKGLGIDLPWRWIIVGAGALGVMWIARPYVAPLLRRAS